MGKLFTAIVPCYNEEDNIKPFYEKFIQNEEFFIHNQINFELIYIDDGSKDETAERVRELNKKDIRVRLISFSRNFGKEAAMYCGLQHAKGEYVAIMDCDLQDPPDLLSQMFIWISKGYDQVATRRVTRDGEPIIRSWFARRFYSIMNKLSDTEIVDGTRDFRLMTRKVVDNILKISEYNRFSKGIFSWVGFNTKWIEYDNIERVKGTSKWNFWSLFRYAIEGIAGYTVKPLELPFIIGGIIDIFSVVTIIIVLILRFCCKFTGVFVSSTFIMILFVLLLFGVQMLVNGIFGEYLAKTYLEVKNRPIYIIDEDTNKE